LYAFDGTSRDDNIENDRDTNVVRFARAYRGCRIYRSGVGTRYGGFGKVLGGWMGLGLHQRVDQVALFRFALLLALVERATTRTACRLG
jgi:hypothetical protein